MQERGHGAIGVHGGVRNPPPLRPGNHENLPEKSKKREQDVNRGRNQMSKHPTGRCNLDRVKK